MTKPAFLWLFWVPVILILTSVNTHFSWSKCLEDQKSLLLQLRSSLDLKLSISRKLATWNQTSDCCEWTGVQCNDSTGQVIGLDLCGESIMGGIDNSSSLFSLRFLQSLNLANNSFNNAQIPSAFGKLSRLIYLNLSNAGFSGQVPMEISQLIKLETLDLSSNSDYLGLSTTKLENPTLGMLIQNLSHIRELLLDGVIITANGSELWKELASSVPRLQVLSLSNCNLSDNIDPSLEKLQSLSEIILAQNNFSMPVPEFLANFANLTVLKLSSCQLTGTVPRRILQVSTLRTLDLSYNTALQGSLPEFPANGSLQNLILSYTRFSGQLPKSIGNLKQLNRIELQNSNFSGLIPSSVAGLNQLGHLDFSDNNFSGPIPSFSAARNLTYLDLSKNMLSGTLSSTDWGRLSNLVSLDLSSNSLIGSIPVDMFSLPSLRKLQLGENKFGGQLREFSSRPSWILDTVDLSNNSLQGSIPRSFFGLKGLKVLKLSFNNFSGSLNLNMIHELVNLTTLELSYNKLSVHVSGSSGRISSFPQLSTLKLASCQLYGLPDFLRNQSRLQFLDLSKNQIQGAIPKWVWTIGNGSASYLNLSCNDFLELERPVPDTPFLQFLDFHSNRLQGEIPIPPSSAFYLDYSENNFTSMPPDIGNSLPYAFFFSISGNQIAGVIPTALCNATSLQVLDLSNNSLNGSIPDCLIQMSQTLKVLNLRENFLTGILPNAFPKECSLSTIDIGQNLLWGHLPKSLAKCKNLEVLNLRQNQLHDTFPAWLMHLSNLRVLVLRCNKLHGSITCRPSDMSWSMLQIIDLAYNDFSGELQAHCFQKLKALMVGADNLLPISELEYPVIPSDNIYYVDSIVISSKGSEIKLQKILTPFKCIDFSKNRFHGNIPEVMGDLNGLIVLNLSHNALSGFIPPSIGNLSMLESLDFSCNHLHGNIPQQMANLQFLEVLNLSFNQLVGTIPTGTQLQSFDASSYMGNKGLSGPPLSNSSTANYSAPSTALAERKRESFDWQLILLGSGFGTGAALVVAPFLFWKKGRKWHEIQVEKLAKAILLSLGIVGYTILDEESLAPEERIGHQLFAIDSYDEDNDDETEDELDYGQFCVFCTKLDIERKRVIHNPRCTCHGSPSISSSTSTSSSR